MKLFGDKNKSDKKLPDEPLKQTEPLKEEENLPPLPQFPLPVITEEKKDSVDYSSQLVSGVSKEPTEFVIKEMMHQKSISREEAIDRLKNPS